MCCAHDIDIVSQRIYENLWLHVERHDLCRALIETLNERELDSVGGFVTVGVTFVESTANLQLVVGASRCKRTDASAPIRARLINFEFCTAFAAGRRSKCS